MPKIEISKAKPEDLYACATISVTSWQKTYQNIINQNTLNKLNIDTRYQKFLNEYQKNPFLVAKINNKVVGFCRYQKDVNIPNYPEADCELTILYLDNNYQRQGIGSALLNYVKKELKNANKHCMIISCLENNTNAINFYLKNKGTIIGKRTFKVDNIKYPETIFKFDLEKE